MIRDRFLTLLFPDSPEDDQVQSQIKSLVFETEAPKMPTSFLKLPSELRQGQKKEASADPPNVRGAAEVVPTTTGLPTPTPHHLSALAID
ncbi:hypothetical protein E2P81_ATG02298 [Venturia nashicola]|nr:hypothetical protein E2P81_ATG02298 [Venturia nashicola]